jgi:ABC-type lipoprotein export system ATPase subunit
MGNLIQLNDISKTYKMSETVEVSALRSVTVEIKRMSMWLLWGRRVPGNLR